MVSNRSVPTDSVLPHLFYSDADAAASWLCDAFGFHENYRVREPDGRIHIAQLLLGPAAVMLRYSREGELSPSAVGGGTQSLMVVVDDVDRHHAHAVESGATVLTPPTDMVYGEREYTVLDLDGHRWTFTQHIADVDPATFTAHPA